MTRRDRILALLNALDHVERDVRADGHREAADVLRHAIARVCERGPEQHKDTIPRLVNESWKLETSDIAKDAGWLPRLQAASNELRILWLDGALE